MQWEMEKCMLGTDLLIEEFVEKYQKETILLLKDLASVPAPSHHEEQRGEFCLKWIKEQGAADAYMDEAGNVIVPYYCQENRKCVAVMAHMDVVFPDTTPFLVVEDPQRLAAPGIGDDTANLVNLLMCIKFVMQNHLVPADMGILFVANTCEEGLGNLKGSNAVFKHYGNRIVEMISFDLYLNLLVNIAVGSHRYRITVKTRGGHSYEDFGNVSAVKVLSDIIQDLYRIQVPKRGKTTYNVGTISGGTSVNTIAEFAEMCYEFRSDDQYSFTYMVKALQQVIDLHQSREADVQAELLGIRPCSSKISSGRLEALVKRQSGIIRKYTNKPVQIISGSTDANIPLSMGIPAVTFGTVAGGGAHTYEEWIEKESMITGQKIALASVLYYFNLV